MSIEAIERFEMILAVGLIVIMFLFFTVLTIICFVISSKKKKINPSDAKTWKTIGIILIAVTAFMLLGVAFAFIVPAMLAPSAAAVLI